CSTARAPATCCGSPEATRSEGPTEGSAGQGGGVIAGEQVGGVLVDGQGPGEIRVGPAAAAQGDEFHPGAAAGVEIIGRITQQHNLVGTQIDALQRGVDDIGVRFGTRGVVGGSGRIDDLVGPADGEQSLQFVRLGGGGDGQRQALVF